MIINEKDTLLTVSQLTQSIKTILESNYRFVKISGEISNLKTPFSGHSYFTLKDDSAQIRSVLFKQQKRFVALELQNGQEVICFGRVTVYEPRGEYQVIVDSVELFGAGRLQIEFERLKRKLAEQDYFRADNKKKVPPYPMKIAVITSPTGAAVHDFLKIAMKREFPGHIQILPVRVQGKEAAMEIARAIETANSLPDIDIIVLCRGGGSLEDLWAFNEEVVATAIHRSNVVVVTGIGHEVDFTIADFCADQRCATPTGVAEAIIPDNIALMQRIDALTHTLTTAIRRKIDSLDVRLQQNIRLLGDLENVLNSAAYRLQLSKSYLVQAMEKCIDIKEKRLQLCMARIERQAPLNRIALQLKHIQFLGSRLRHNMERIIERKQSLLARQAALLNGVSPLATLGRGYSIVRKFEPAGRGYQVISDATKTAAGDELNILLHKGEIDCVVKKTSKQL
ncbi:MAG: exodeoxyribonuclease VII large subunit [Desulforhopalus sp.]